MKKLRGSKIKSFAQGHTAGHVRAMTQTHAAFSLTSPNGAHVSGSMREVNHTCPEVACAISPTWRKTDVICCLKPGLPSQSGLGSSLVIVTCLDV